MPTVSTINSVPLSCELHHRPGRKDTGTASAYLSDCIGKVDKRMHQKYSLGKVGIVSSKYDEAWKSSIRKLQKESERVLGRSGLGSIDCSEIKRSSITARYLPPTDQESCARLSAECTIEWNQKNDGKQAPQSNLRDMLSQLKTMLRDSATNSPGSSKLTAFTVEARFGDEAASTLPEGRDPLASQRC